MSDSKNPLKDADDILFLYTLPSEATLIDSGNLFYAATEYKKAYTDALKIIEEMAGALEFYAPKENWNEFISGGSIFDE